MAPGVNTPPVWIPKHYPVVSLFISAVGYTFITLLVKTWYTIAIYSSGCTVSALA